MSTALSVPPQAVIPNQDPGPDWKQQLTERLDAYRSRRQEEKSSFSAGVSAQADSRASRIARAVASRYAAAPTYSELLLAAAQAERAAQEALADHEKAMRERAELEAIAVDQGGTCAAESDGRNSLRHSLDPIRPQETPDEGEQAFAERYGSPIHTQSATPVMPQFATRTKEMHVHQTTPEPEPSLEDLWASALVEPRALLPSKLIEFPRELVSSRRARPHLPEAPDSRTPLPEAAQLRIFEVHAETESHAAIEPAMTEAASEATVETVGEAARQNPLQKTAPDFPERSEPATFEAAQRAAAMSRLGASVQAWTATHATSAPLEGRASSASTARAFKNLEWAAISLDREQAAVDDRSAISVADYAPFLVDPASIDRRLMAFAVDFAAVTAGFLGFLLVFAASTPHLPAGATAAALAGAVYLALWVLYQALFFSLSGATAGMQYAHIALCTFDDQNPTRLALRKRLGAWWLSCLPLGLGFLWCFVDEDNLSWHDRITRTYQREY